MLVMLDGVLRQIVRESELAEGAMVDFGKLGVDGQKTPRPETLGYDAARWFCVAHALLLLRRIGWPSQVQVAWYVTTLSR